MVTLEFMVKGQRLQLLTDVRKIKPVSDTVNYFWCHFTFDEEWSDMSNISIEFKNASFGVSKEIVLNDNNAGWLPWEVLANTGVVICNAVGFKIIEGTIVKKIPTDTISVFVIRQEGELAPKRTDIPTPTEYQQFVNNVQGYRDEVLVMKSEVSGYVSVVEGFKDAALTYRDQALIYADNASVYAANSSSYADISLSYSQLAAGYAARIENMSVEAETLDPGEEATVEKSEEGGVFHLKFGIPKGEKGEMGSLDWGDIENKPGTFPPSAHNHTKSEITDFAHNHDDRYYTETETDEKLTDAKKWANITGKPSTFPPSSHNHDDRYYTEAETDSAIGAETSRATQRENEIEGEIPDVINAVNSTSTDNALSANMGKELQAQITNLKNLGRFCAIWRADTGLPTSEPTETPYVYKVGDYFRIGTAGYRVPKGSTYVQGVYDTVAEETGIGDVWYYDGTVWKKQASSGGGTVQDVQVNGTSVLDGGIANVLVPTLLSQLTADATHRLVTDTEKITWNGKYAKPSTGIPKSDLASAVQQSLGRADTALQAHQDISGKEDKSNKVTSMSASSTHTQYPSAKAVYEGKTKVTINRWESDD